MEPTYWRYSLRVSLLLGRATADQHLQHSGCHTRARHQTPFVAGGGGRRLTWRSTWSIDISACPPPPVTIRPRQQARTQARQRAQLDAAHQGEARHQAGQERQGAAYPDVEHPLLRLLVGHAPIARTTSRTGFQTPLPSQPSLGPMPRPVPGRGAGLLAARPGRTRLAAATGAQGLAMAEGGGGVRAGGGGRGRREG